MRKYDCYIKLADHCEASINQTILTAQERGLNGLIISVSTPQEEKQTLQAIGQLRVSEDRELEIMVGQRVRCWTHSHCYSMEEDGSFHEEKTEETREGDVLLLGYHFIASDTVPNLDELYRKVKEQNGTVLGLPGESYLDTIARQTCRPDGIIITSTDHYLSKQIWEEVHKKPVYGGSGLTTPSNIGMFVSQFPSGMLRSNILLERKGSLVLMHVQEGNYQPFRCPDTVLEIDFDRTKGLKGLDFHGKRKIRIDGHKI